MMCRHVVSVPTLPLWRISEIGQTLDPVSFPEIQLLKLCLSVYVHVRINRYRCCCVWPLVFAACWCYLVYRCLLHPRPIIPIQTPLHLVRDAVPSIVHAR